MYKDNSARRHIRAYRSLFVTCILLASLLICISAYADSGDSWTCPNCGKVNTKLFCGDCGTKKPEQRWICECGNENTTLFCENCGRSKDEVIKNSVTQKPEKTEANTPTPTSQSIVIEVKYTCDNEIVATEKVSVSIGSTTIIHPNTNMFSDEYELKDPPSVAINVSSKGIPMPASAQFRLKRKSDNTIYNTIQPTKRPIRKVRINDGSTPNVRATPATNGKIVGHARSGQIYGLLEASGTWYKIRLEDETEGWIASGMATIIGAPLRTPKSKATKTTEPTHQVSVLVQYVYDSQVVGSQIIQLSSGTSTYVYADLSCCPNYELDGVRSVKVTVTARGIASPNTVIFRVKPTSNLASTPKRNATPKPTAKPAEKPSDSKSGTTTRKIDDWYISDDGKYGIQIFGLDKNYDGSYYVTIYIMQMSSRQIIASSDITVMDKSEVDEWMALAEKYSDDFQFHLSDNHAIQEFCYESYKYYSFNIVVDIVRNGRFDDPIMFQNGISFRIP